MRSENRSRWVNLLLPTLRQMTNCLTSWLQQPVVQNAASLLVGLFMTFMTTSQSNRIWSGKTSQLTSVTWLVLRGLREWPNGGSISGNRCSLIVRMECQKWRNITRKFGVTSAGLYLGLVLSGVCPTRAWHDPRGTCSGVQILVQLRHSPHHNFRPL